MGATGENLSRWVVQLLSFDFFHRRVLRGKEKLDGLTHVCRGLFPHLNGSTGKSRNKWALKVGRKFRNHG